MSYLRKAISATTVGRFCYGCAISLFLALPLSAQSVNRSNFDLGAANFATEKSGLSRLDLFIQITNDQVQFIQTRDDLFVAEYEVIVDVFDENGLIVDGKEYSDKIMATEIEETSTRRKFHISTVTFFLPPQKYEILVAVQDMETHHQSTEKISVDLQDYSDPQRFVSDILVLDNYSRDANDNLVFQPRLSSYIRPGSDVYLYFEVYHVPEGEKYEFSYDIKGPESRHWSDTIVEESRGKTSENFIQIARDSLVHGNYEVSLTVRYEQHSMSVEKSFEWLIEGLPLTFKNVREAIETLKYIASEDEYERLVELDESEMYDAYLEFWNKIDPSPDTPTNELRTEYYGRIEYANEHYQGFRKDGWKTDMGWVYVKLGAPDNVDRTPYNTQLQADGRSVKAVQVWVYNQYGRRLFFVDENGYGDYRLTNRLDFFDILR